MRFHSLKCSHAPVTLPTLLANPFETMAMALNQKSWGMVFR